jgi:predicted PurR-regulated permease PerM
MIMKTEQSSGLNLTTAATLFLIFVTILWIGKDVLIPLAFAVLLWFVVVSWRDLIVKLFSFGQSVPMFIQNTLAFVSFVVLMFILGGLVSGDIGKVALEFPKYQENVAVISGYVSESFGIPLPTDEERTQDALAFTQQAAGFISSALGTIFVVILYVVFIFSEQKNLSKKLRISTGSSYAGARSVLEDIVSKIKQYIGTKTLLSITTAVLSYVVFTFVGLDLPFLWAFVIFILNYIPSIGSMVATVVPALFAILQFGGYVEAIIIVATVGLIQFSIGNILEPKLMGKKLNISPLVVVIALFSWGALWGIPGMFLSVPLTVVLMIIMAHIPVTKPIAIWLSGDGEV